MKKNWYRIRDVAIPLDQVGGVVLQERKSGEKSAGYQLTIMVSLGIIPILYENEDRNEARSDLTELVNALNDRDSCN